MSRTYRVIKDTKSDDLMLHNGDHLTNFDTKFYDGDNDKESFVHSLEDSKYIFPNTAKGDKDLQALRKEKNVRDDIKNGNAKVVRMTATEIYGMYKDRIKGEQKLHENTDRTEHFHWGFEVEVTKREIRKLVEELEDFAADFDLDPEGSVYVEQLRHISGNTFLMYISLSGDFPHYLDKEGVWQMIYDIVGYDKVTIQESTKLNEALKIENLGKVEVEGRFEYPATLIKKLVDDLYDEVLREAAKDDDIGYKIGKSIEASLSEDDIYYIDLGFTSRKELSGKEQTKLEQDIINLINREGNVDDIYLSYHAFQLAIGESKGVEQKRLLTDERDYIRQDDVMFVYGDWNREVFAAYNPYDAEEKEDALINIINEEEGDIHEVFEDPYNTPQEELIRYIKDNYDAIFSERRDSVVVLRGEVSKDNLNYYHDVVTLSNFYGNRDEVNGGITGVEWRGSMNESKRVRKGRALKENTSITAQDVLDAIENLSYLSTENFDGHVVIYLYKDRDDVLSGEMVNKIIREGEGGNAFEAFYEIIDEVTMQSFDYLDSNIDYTVDTVLEDLEQERGIKLTQDEIDDIKDELRDVLHAELPVNEYLEDEYSVFFNVDTGDANYDFTLNPTGSTLDVLDDEDFSKASIVWLAETQGYSQEELVAAIKEGGSDSVFLHSVVTEVYEAYSSMNSLVFLGTMDLKTILRTVDKSGAINVPKETVVGLWDGWSGSGSSLGIELEKDIVVDASIIDRLYEAYSKNGDVYNLEEIYGLGGSFYNRVNFTEVGGSVNESTNSLNESVYEFGRGDRGDIVKVTFGTGTAYLESIRVFVPKGTSEEDIVEQALVKYLEDGHRYRIDIIEEGSDEFYEAVEDYGDYFDELYIYLDLSSEGWSNYYVNTEHLSVEIVEPIEVSVVGYYYDANDVLDEVLITVSGVDEVIDIQIRNGNTDGLEKEILNAFKFYNLPIEEVYIADSRPEIDFKFEAQETQSVAISFEQSLTESTKPYDDGEAYFIMEEVKKMKRLLNKEDLEYVFKADLIDEVLVNELINKDTESPYSWEELEVLSHEELVNLLVDSQKIYITEDTESTKPLNENTEETYLNIWVRNNRDGVDTFIDALESYKTGVLEEQLLEAAGGDWLDVVDWECQLDFTGKGNPFTIENLEHLADLLIEADDAYLLILQAELDDGRLVSELGNYDNATVFVDYSTNMTTPNEALAYAWEDAVGLYDGDYENFFDFEKFGRDYRISGDLDMFIADHLLYDEELLNGAEPWDVVSDENADLIVDDYLRERVQDLFNMSDYELGEDATEDFNISELPNAHNYFDYERFGRDLSFDYTYTELTNGVSGWVRFD